MNQTGIAQAKLQVENLRSVIFDACFCSPQKRARQTCEIIYKGPIVLDDRLAEINCGEFEGTEETADSFNCFDKQSEAAAWARKASKDLQNGTAIFVI